MTVNFSILILYIITVVAIIAVPGPVALLVTGAGLKDGPGAAFRTILGTNIASLAMILASALIVKGLLVVDPFVFELMKVGGALYIGFIGWQMFSDARNDPVLSVQVPAAGGFRKGFLVAISNPKDIIFFASLFPQFFHLTPDPDVSIGLLTLVWIILDFATLMLVYQLVRVLLRPSMHTKMLRLSGGFLMLLAGLGLVTAVVNLLHANQ